MMKKLFSLVLALTTATTLAFATDLTTDCGKSVTLTANPSTGYHFVEWHDADNHVVGTVGTPTLTVSASTTTYTAVFAADVYTIYYKDKGNVNFSGTHASGYPTTHTYGTATTLKGATKTGYDFGGWFIASNCSGTALTALGATAYTADITLYARWDAQTYNITYKDQNNANFSGTHGNNHPTTHTYGTATTLVNPTKDGYDFGGWYTNAACTGTAVTTIAADAYTADFTLYAKWTAQTYAITYKDQNNAAFSGTHETGYPTTHTYGAATALDSPTKDGYDFGGWFTNAACTGTAVTTIAADAYTADFTLYAKWNIQSYTIRFYVEEGGALIGDGTFSKTYEYGATVTAPVAGTDFNKASTDQYDYEFLAWTPTLSSTATGSVDYKATWTPILRSYTVTFRNHDNGSVITSDQVPYGNVPDKPTGTPTHTTVTGKTFTFTGWVNVATNQFYAKDIALPAVTGDVIYEAKFDEGNQSYVITVEKDATTGGATESINTTGGTWEFGSEHTITASTTDGCKQFKHWTSGGAIVSTSASYTFEVSGPATFTAVWEYTQVTVTGLPNDTTYGTVTISE